MKSRHALALIGLATLSACGSMHEAMHTKRATELTTHLTLLPLAHPAPNTAIPVDTKITTLKTRAVLTPQDLKPAPGDTLTYYALDSSFTDFQTLKTTPTKIDGLFHFTFTPRTTNSYRIWAETEMKNDAPVEYPYNDIGTRTPGKFTRIESWTQTLGSASITLSSDTRLKRFNEATLSLKSGESPLPITDAVAFYDDYRTLLHFTPTDGKITFSPDKQGYVKIFIRSTINGKETTLPFTFEIAKD